MRLLKIVVAAVLVIGPLIAGVPAAAGTAELVQQLDELSAAFPGGVGLWIADPSSSRPIYTRDPDEHVIAASLYKLGVLAEAERRVETGELHYSDIITIQPEDTIEYSYEEAGTELTLDEALEAMITISDNGTALALWRLLGGANIDATLIREGLPDFHVALDDTEDNVVTPRAVGTFFSLLAKKELISIAASERMLARLERQQIVDRLPASLPEGVVIAHKTGNLVGAVHDAGIVFTPSGPRVVVAMTWDAYDDDANAFIANVGALVYGAVLEPPANARFGVPRAAVEGDSGSRVRVTVSVTNTGTNTWAASGPDSVALYWQLQDDAGKVVGTAPAASRLPALAPNRQTNVGLQIATPATPGLWHVTLSLTDGSGRMLASLGAATATFDIKTHAPYLVRAAPGVPLTLHRGEPSLMVTTYTALPATGEADHSLVLAWRALDPSSGRIVAEGSSSIGVLKPGATGAFYSAFVAPRLLGTYKLSYELREGDVAVSETASQTVTILRRRTYPDDEGGRTPAAQSVFPTPPPAPTRSAFPRPSTSLVPRITLPSLPTPKGKPTPNN
jgi:beta-lactamase class A